MTSTSTANCIACCCCLKVEQRDTVPAWMLGSKTSGPPSLFRRLCLCQCFETERVLSGIEKLPQLRSLAGVSLQDGKHSTAGSLQTLRWGKYDPETRSILLSVFGGGCFPGGAGLWSEPVSCTWVCLANFARCCNYSYNFKFAEDHRSVVILLRANGCCCVPCLPPCIEIPSSILAFKAQQAEDSRDGSHWIRTNSSCGGPDVFAYDLVEVFAPDGKPGRFHDRLQKAPQQVMVSC